MRCLKQMLTLLLLAPFTLIGQTIVFVDADATGTNSGTSWTDAYTDLQPALSAAVSGTEIWVAEGIYIPGDTVTATFQLLNGVELYGGFSGVETARDQRDWDLNLTFLSGDIGQDDVYGIGTWYSGWNINSFNSHHVVVGNGTDNTAVIDGFRIGQGYSSVGFGGDPYANSGGGMLIVGGSPVVRNCEFWRNEAGFAPGGGVYLDGGNPQFIDCDFTENNVHLSHGAGMYITGSSQPKIEGCTFTANFIKGGHSYSSGAGIYHFGTNPLKVNNCVFRDNLNNYYSLGSNAAYGAGIFCLSDNMQVSNSLFENNSSHGGGAIANWGTGGLIVNCVFKGNTATSLETGSGIDQGDIGGAIMTNSFSATGDSIDIVNCTFTENSAGEGGGIFGAGSPGTFIRIRNSILWNNNATGTEVTTLKAQISGNEDIEYSCVEGIFDTIPGEDPPNPADFPGVIHIDPLLDPGMGLFGPLTGSPVIDAGNNFEVPAGLTVDYEGNARFMDDPATADSGLGSAPLVDMGAVEFLPASSCNTTSVPDGLAAGITGPTTVSLSWNAVTDADKYQIQGNTLGSGGTASTVTSTNSKNIGSLTPGAGYFWKVRARCAVSGEITAFSVTDTFYVPAVREVMPLQAQVYPTVASDFVYIKLPTPHQAQLRILDSQGRLLRQIQFAGTYELNISMLNEGLYLLHLQQSGLQEVHKIQIIRD